MFVIETGDAEVFEAMQGAETLMPTGFAGIIAVTGFAQFAILLLVEDTSSFGGIEEIDAKTSFIWITHWIGGIASCNAQSDGVGIIECYAQ
jgi:hypothetical protein